MGLAARSRLARTIRKPVLAAGAAALALWGAPAQAARELSEAEAITAATAPAGPARAGPVVLGTLRGAPVWAETLCAEDCAKGADRVVYFQLSGDVDRCADLDGVWAEVPSGPGRQRLFCIPRNVRYAQELAQAPPLSAQDLADFATGAQRPEPSRRGAALGAYRGVLVRSEHHSGDTGLFGTWIVWLDPPKGQACEAAGGVARAVTVPHGIVSSREGFCLPEPYAEAQDREREAALQRARRRLTDLKPDTPATPPAPAHP